MNNLSKDSQTELLIILAKFILNKRLEVDIRQRLMNSFSCSCPEAELILHWSSKLDEIWATSINTVPFTLSVLI
jgi:hypothetical protein